MSLKRFRNDRLKKQLFTKNRLVILNEETFEEIFSLKLTLMNVFLVGSLGAFVIIFVTTYIIAFTPLKEYIPGYSSSKLKQEATNLALKSDSLTTLLQNNELYLRSVRRALTGDVDFMKLNNDSIKAGGVDTNDLNLNPSESELELRKKVTMEDKYNLFETAKPRVDLVLFPPVRGPITEKYNVKEKHFAIDIALPKNTPIKAVANGTVIFADWTPTNGNVIILRHNNEFLSVYKHCESLNVSQGDVVRTSEIIAMGGTSGEQSTGIHLHFELWKDGYPIDPTQFIDFE